MRTWSSWPKYRTSNHPEPYRSHSNRRRHLSENCSDLIIERSFTTGSEVNLTNPGPIVRLYAIFGCFWGTTSPRIVKILRILSLFVNLIIMPLKLSMPVKVIYLRKFVKNIFPENSRRWLNDLLTDWHINRSKKQLRCLEIKPYVILKFEFSLKTFET